MSSDLAPTRFELKSLLQPEHRVWWWVCLGLAALYVPVLRELFATIWSTDEQGHGPIVLGLAVWLLWRAWPEFNDPSKGEPDLRWGWGLLALAMLVFLFGRSQRILSVQTLSAILALVSVALLVRGPRQLRCAWFGLFFMIFMVPLPGALVDAVTQPLKLAVSSVATWALSGVGYPIARSGVILQIGPYQLLVADACAGLHTLFTLEAMGLLYLNVVRSASAFRNITLAILIVPISFAANVIRVVTLSLITYHFGDAAGQGFLHGFSGMVLFMAALLLTMSLDGVLRWVDAHRSGAST